MIGVLLGINVLLSFLIVLTTAMVQNHFKKIEKSLAIYADPKAYKPHSQIAFIDGVKTKIQACDLESAKIETIERIIQKEFYQQKVGSFQYTTIEKIATKSKLLMWVVLAGQIALEVMAERPGSSMMHFSWIIISALLCLCFLLVGVIKNITEQREQFFKTIEDYIINIYPTEISKRNKSKDYIALLEKLDALTLEPDEVGVTQEPVVEVGVEAHLKEEDIQQFLHHLDKNA